jgi:glycosyltransferase involved in cell wall biosynthesis
VSASAVDPGRRERDSSTLVVFGVVNPGSVGVSRYAALLARELSEEGVVYPLLERAPREGPVHVHLANSSRSLLTRRTGRAPFVVTVHDVVPRTRALLPLYRALAYPRIATAAAVIVHSTLAADMLLRVSGRRPRRLEVIPHAAFRPCHRDRTAARQALGWSEDDLIAVVPGAIRSVKLVRDVLAAKTAPEWRIALVGRLAERSLARDAAARGALVLADPDSVAYEHAIVAADCVLCLRSGSVGETNGPLLEALGAGRAVLATPTGSIPEVAGDAVLFCNGMPRSIAARLNELAEPHVRAKLEASAETRGAELTWRASAQAHAALFREVLDV